LAWSAFGEQVDSSSKVALNKIAKIAKIAKIEKLGFSG